MDAYRCKVGRHGPEILEISMHYPLDTDRPGRQHYDLQAYFFAPYQLGMSADRYGPDDFFRDLHSYTRQGMPEIGIDHVLDSANPLSPLGRIRSALEAHGAGGTLDERVVLYEFKTLVNVAGAQGKAHRDAVRNLDDPPACRTHATRALDQFDRLQAAFADLEPLVLAPGVPEAVRDAWRWTDEALSLRAEKTAVQLYRHLQRHDACRDLSARCTDAIRAQMEHRRQRDYAAFVDPDDPRRNEFFLYREHALKKWAESALYMTVKESRVVRSAVQFLFGVAAAVAMGFVLILSVLASDVLGAGGVYGALIVLIGYIFKDRIKDVLRAFFLRAVPRWIADRVSRIRDPKSGRVCGRTGERVHHTALDRLPEAVRRIRGLRRDAFRELMRREDVIHYSKEIRFDSRALLQSHQRLGGLVEILRLDMGPWLRAMDRPRRTLYALDGDGLEPVKAERVYHVALVLGLQRKGEEAATLYRYRIVLSRNGLRRIETVETSTV